MTLLKHANQMCFEITMYIQFYTFKIINLTPLMNFSKLVVLLKSNLKLQTYNHETTKQKIMISHADFSKKI